MSRLHTVLARHRDLRNRWRAERDIQRAASSAPTVESAHEITALSMRR
jgi:hypothetical protein